MDRFAQMIVAAARQAEADSGIDIAKEADRIGASIATGIGGLGAFQDCYQTLIDRGPDRVNPFSITAIIPNMGAGWVSMELGTRGPLSSQCTACAASNMAIGEGADAIRLGRADAMICGGTEARDHAGRHRRLRRDARSLAPQRRSEARLASVRRRRDGFVMGEAGGAVVLEELEHAKARGAKIYARADRLRRLVGREPRHRAGPGGHEPGARDDDGLRRRGHRSVRDRLHQRARHLDAARRHVRDARDQARARRGERAQDPMSSTKGATGHCLGAAGAVEAIFTILATQRGILPPTINYEVEDPTLRPRLHPERGAEGRHHRRRLELLRLRRRTTPASSSASSTSSHGAPPSNSLLLG